MKKNLFILLASVLFLNINAIELDVETTIQMAYNNNIEVRNAMKNIENYELMKKEAIKNGLPTIKFSGQYLKIEDVDDELGANNISLEQPIYVGGAVLEGIKVSKISNEYGYLELKNAKQNIKLNVLTMYSNILKLDKNLETLKKSLEELTENYRLVEEQYKLDMITKTAVLQIKYRMIELESNIIDLENNIDILKMNLKKEIGLEVYEEIELKTEEYLFTWTEEIDLDNDIVYASHNNVNIQMTEIASKLKKSSEVLERADLLPKVGFNFNYGNGQEVLKVADSFKNDNMNWTAGIGVSMTLWDWGKNYNKLQRAKNETSKVKDIELDTKQAIAIGVRAKYMDLVKLQKLIEAKHEAVKSAEENYKLEKEKFESRLITAADFLEAENHVRNSKVDLINTMSDYYVAYQNYEIIIGR